MKIERRTKIAEAQQLREQRWYGNRRASMKGSVGGGGGKEGGMWGTPIRGLEQRREGAGRPRSHLRTYPRHRAAPPEERRELKKRGEGARERGKKKRKKRRRGKGSIASSCRMDGKMGRGTGFETGHRTSRPSPRLRGAAGSGRWGRRDDRRDPPVPAEVRSPRALPQCLSP